MGALPNPITQLLSLSVPFKLHSTRYQNSLLDFCSNGFPSSPLHFLSPSFPPRTKWHFLQSLPAGRQASARHSLGLPGLPRGSCHSLGSEGRLSKWAMYSTSFISPGPMKKLKQLLVVPSQRCNAAGSEGQHEPGCCLCLGSGSPHPLLTFGNIDLVGCQDVRLNAIYFCVQELGVVLRIEAGGAWLGTRAVCSWSGA